MPFPINLNGKIEFKSADVKPESLRDVIVSSLSEIHGYSIHTDDFKIIITFLWSSFFRAGGGALKGLSNGEISLYSKETSLVVEYKFSMKHLFVICTVVVGLLFIINIKNPLTTTSVGLIGLGLLWFMLFVGTYILTSIMTSIRFPKFLKRCVSQASELHHKQ
jgi:hypothetical protein